MARVILLVKIDFDVRKFRKIKFINGKICKILIIFKSRCGQNVYNH